MSRMQLYRRNGWGSAIVEAQLAHYGLEAERIEVADLFLDPAAKRDLMRISPAGQIPVLILPDGRVMSESAAITLHLADMTERDDLVPAPGASERPRFLRWLMFLVAQVYPCFTFGDDPSRFLSDGTAQKELGEATTARLQELWTAVEGVAGAPWFLGERFSALDIYLAVMTNWKPGPEWFQGNAPKVWAIARATAAREDLAPVLQRNFG
ncbi:glutathione S-transferase family protein [Paracoccus sp. MA]|uniref:glutathione S-transferase family protein n=1 Tax=Paracoccus sp. MA TaxID=2895796 RepID=UPI000FB3CB98|nr:glutathione S-transferase family protein [Paracoccus sp. MA]RQP08291.1 MAG: glutathione S-transferase family protein [Paracoccus sp. BP8]UFM65918.1 glutathione S-transferase family protein [Paracoccus sp. MA]